MAIRGDSVRNLGPGRPNFLPKLNLTYIFTEPVDVIGV
jgi:hypothetical protein